MRVTTGRKYEQKSEHQPVVVDDEEHRKVVLFALLVVVGSRELRNRAVVDVNPFLTGCHTANRSFEALCGEAVRDK